MSAKMNNKAGLGARPANWMWDELTSPDFVRAVKTTSGTCIVPVGVIEVHGRHLPLGTDARLVEILAQRAVQREPALVLPAFFFGQTHETKNLPGSLAIRGELIFALLENLCEELARNGIKRIILFNGHGGNEYVLPFFAMKTLEKKRPYTVYVVRLQDYYPDKDPGWDKLKQSKVGDWHAGEMETSLALALLPGLVRMQAVPRRPGVSQARLKHLPSLLTGTWWYAMFPDQYSGDASLATLKKGEYLVNFMVRKLAAVIKGVKKDRVTPRLEAEYHRACDHSR